jgi:flagellar biogenesis protein FliO
MNLIGLVILFSAYAVNRFIMTNATKNLTDSDKLKIFEVFSKRNNYSTVLVLAIVLLYFGALQYLPHFIIQITAIYLTIFAAYLIFRFISNYKKLKQLEMPANYIKSFIASYGIFTFGFLTMAFCVMWDWTE